MVSVIVPEVDENGVCHPFVTPLSLEESERSVLEGVAAVPLGMNVGHLLQLQGRLANGK